MPIFKVKTYFLFLLLHFKKRKFDPKNSFMGSLFLCNTSSLWGYNISLDKYIQRRKKWSYHRNKAHKANDASSYLIQQSELGRYLSLFCQVDILHPNEIPSRCNIPSRRHSCNSSGRNNTPGWNLIGYNITTQWYSTPVQYSIPTT